MYIACQCGQHGGIKVNTAACMEQAKFGSQLESVGEVTDSSLKEQEKAGCC
jgi:hypothetical protein